MHHTFDLSGQCMLDFVLLLSSVFESLVAELSYSSRRGLTATARFYKKCRCKDSYTGSYAFQAHSADVLWLLATFF